MTTFKCIPPSSQVENTNRVLEVAVLWGTRSVLHVEHLVAPRAFCIGEPNGEREIDFVIGSDAIGMEYWPLCMNDETGASVIIPAHASAQITKGGRNYPLSLAYVRKDFQESRLLPGAKKYRLDEDTSIRIRQGEFTFSIRNLEASQVVTTSQRPDPKPWAYVGLTALLTMIMLVGFYLMPPRPRGFDSNLPDRETRLIKFLMKNSLPSSLPKDLLRSDSDTVLPGGKEGDGVLGEQAPPPKGKERDNTSKTKRPTSLTKKSELVQIRRAGVLGTLSGMRDAFAQTNSSLSADRVLSNDPMSVLTVLHGHELSTSLGVHGIDMKNAGRGTGHDGHGTIPTGIFKTDGFLPSGSRPGTGLKRPGGQRDSNAPRVRLSSDASVQGDLSKEVIQRVVREHKSEIRYCYEQALAARPDLSGRVSVKFVISQTGSVQSSTVHQSDLANASVESCITSSVRRWTFPAPSGGGIVVVRYPFVFEVAGN